MSRRVHPRACPGCATPIEPRHFACRTCWLTLPEPLRVTLLLHYRPGQEDDAHPTQAYLAAARAARGRLSRTRDETHAGFPA